MNLFTNFKYFWLEVSFVRYCDFIQNTLYDFDMVFFSFYTENKISYFFTTQVLSPCPPCYIYIIYHTERSNSYALSSIHSTVFSG